MSRREECPSCGADQHVCKLCRHYQPGISDECTEDRAEAVTDKERANFCDYFEPAHLNAESIKPSAEQQALSELQALFGEQPSESTPAEVQQSKADQALADLNDLFNKD